MNTVLSVESCNFICFGVCGIVQNALDEVFNIGVVSHDTLPKMNHICSLFAEYVNPEQF